MYFFILFIQAVIAWFLIAPLLKLLLIGLSKLVYRPMSTILNVEYNYNYAAIVTVPEGYTMLEDMIESFNKQTYKNFTVYFVLDYNSRINVFHLSSNRIKFLVPNKPFHSKVNAIAFALDAFEQDFDGISLFDAGNLLHPNYFQEINKEFCKGNKAVQGAIEAKNFNSITANLDAANDAFYSFHDKESRNQLGLSASIWNLGFCIDSVIFSKIIKKVHKSSIIGYDKVIQAKLLLHTNHVAYAAKAIVFEEKINSRHIIQHQANWFLNVIEALPIFFKGMQTLSFDRLNYALNMMRPPLTLVFLMACFLAVLNIFMWEEFVLLMPIALASIIFAFFAILAIKKVDKRIWRSMHQFPRLLLIQLFNLFIIRKASASKYITPPVIDKKVNDLLVLHK